MFDVVKGAPRVRSWPKKRGPAKSDEHKAQTDFFRHASWAAKFMHPEIQVIFAEARKNTPLLPRDLAFMMLANTMFITVFEGGKVAYPVQFITKVSESLDAITQTPGQFLVRGEQFWQGTSMPTSTPWWWSPPDLAGWTAFSPDSTLPTFVWNPTKGTSIDLNTVTAGLKVRYFIRSLPNPSGNWQLDFRMDFFLDLGNYSTAGLVLKNSGNARLLTMHIEMNNELKIAYWNSATSFGSQPYARNFPIQSAYKFWRVAKVGSNLLFSISPDGVTYLQIASLSATAWLTSGPNEIGIGGLYDRSTGLKTAISAQRWVLT